VRFARLAAGVLAASVALFGAAGAYADKTSGTNRDAATARADGAELARKTRSAALELYGLEAQLARVRTQLAGLRAQTAAAARLERQERAHLAEAQGILAEAEASLGARLRELYVEGEPDALAILLGAESLEDAISTLDSLGRFAERDTAIVAQVKEARHELRLSVQDLTSKAARLRALTLQAEAAEASLLAARKERLTYLARLAEARRLNQAELARLVNIAKHAEEKAEEIGGGGSNPLPGDPAGPGTRLTVLATGYSLPGTTATGIPVAWGVVAVDPSVIPLGTRMYVPGYGEGVAADTGSAVRGRVIDLWFPTRAQALAWGRRTVTITIH
jgi:3D (Asp-Asp-Asp) domain-containing protein/peptidoglycan hydrolase CwlO-like protein